VTGPKDDLGFDPEALVAKYRRERDKRLRPDSLDQFIPTKGDFRHYREDRYIEAGFTRAPLTDEVEIAIIGGGFCGLLLGAQLRRADVEGIRFIDRAGDFGGTWYWNRYPGAACDTESYIYLPLLEELGYIPPRKYATGPEIFEHCRRIARTFDLYRDTCFQTEVTNLRWDEAAYRWVVSTNRDDAIRARFVVVSPGPMDKPKLAGIPGIETFKGHSFHTSRWDYDYTGGSSAGGLTGLNDKVVGIVGTGATAVQCIPHLAEGARRLHVFQRTPSSIDERNDRPTNPEWVAGLQPGWQQKRIENFTILTSGGAAQENLTNDGWTGIARNVQRLIERKKARGETVEATAALTQTADYMKMEEVRARVDAIVKDKAAAEALKPWYNQFCKRPCFHDEYLPTFNRPNVRLVDTDGRGVDRITHKGVVVAGKEYGIDCLVYSTGFEVGAPLARRIGYDIVGRDSVRLVDKWSAGAATLHGFLTSGFPNLFFMSHVQSGFSLNFTHMISEQAKHIAHILSRGVKEGIQIVEATQEAECAWVAEMDRAAVSQEAFQRECTPSYFNFEGDLKRSNARNSFYGGGFVAFYAMLEKWRAQSTMPGLSLVRE
jgi:cation diffusion facilitator CzcD-associated flavoprotein CzcO